MFALVVQTSHVEFYLLPLTPGKLQGKVNVQNLKQVV